MTEQGPLLQDTRFPHHPSKSRTCLLTKPESTINWLDCGRQELAAVCTALDTVAATEPEERRARSRAKGLDEMSDERVPAVDFSPNKNRGAPNGAPLSLSQSCPALPYMSIPMPPPPPPPGIAGFSSGMSQTSALVVRIMAAMEQAFSTALRVTLTGSMMPAFSMST